MAQDDREVNVLLEEYTQAGMSVRTYLGQIDRLISIGGPLIVGLLTLGLTSDSRVVAVAAAPVLLVSSLVLVRVIQEVILLGAYRSNIEELINRTVGSDRPLLVWETHVARQNIHETKQQQLYFWGFSVGVLVFLIIGFVQTGTLLKGEMAWVGPLVYAVVCLYLLGVLLRAVRHIRASRDQVTQRLRDVRHMSDT